MGSQRSKKHAAPVGSLIQGSGRDRSAGYLSHTSPTLGHTDMGRKDNLSQTDPLHTRRWYRV